MPRSTIAALLLALCAGCVTTNSSVPAREPSEGPWLEASPTLRERLADAARRLPWTHGLERVELIQWFASVGEPAYPTLLELAADPRADVAGAALASLGATRDSRLVEPLRSVTMQSAGSGTDLSFERARALLRLGDWREIPVLVDGLRDERLITRALCAQALHEATHERHGFDPRGEPDAREAAVGRWEEWWKAREQDRLLQGNK